ncbi:hypothetical protein [Thalassospira alkalitolerans]|uniref:hypothetical protein n=1 Tax=Thalassospira alkalitolerans TaxID=1293890 RepID=UPI003AA7AE0A
MVLILNMWLAMDFDAVWGVVSPAVDLADEGVTKEEVLQGLLEGSLLCFSLEKSAAIVTFARGGRLRVALAGGDLEELKLINEDILQYARDAGYRGVEIIGRPGWERALPDYEKAAIILRQDFKP